jgi:hypothetical protein
VQGAEGLKDKGRGMLCGHTTCKGFTAVRRSRNGHPEVARTHRDGDKPGKQILGLVTSPRSVQTPPRLHRRGGGCEGRIRHRDIKSSGNNGNETDRSVLEWRVAVWPVMEMEIEQCEPHSGGGCKWKETLTF